MACEHNRILHVQAKADDRQSYHVRHLDLQSDGYAPHIPGVARGDYIGLRICLDCCKVIDMHPMADEELMEAFS